MLVSIFISLVLVNQSWAAADPSHVSPSSHSSSERSSDQLSALRRRVLVVEENLIEGLKVQKQAKSNLKKLQELIQLRRQEKEIGRKRLGELESTISELESRREMLMERITHQRETVRKSLLALAPGLAPASQGVDAQVGAASAERLEAPRRKLLANMASRGLNEIETLRVDLEDSKHIESRIQEEKQQLAYLMQDLYEKENVLELNRQLQADLLKKHHEERVAQLESYRKLKNSEAQVEHLIQEFSVRSQALAESAPKPRKFDAGKELRDRVRGESLMMSAFAQLKGRLSLPVAGGQIVSGFGKAVDPRSKLVVFKKGIDIQTGKEEPVRAVSGGKIAFSGQLPEYGQVAIIDHGDHFYSLCAHLGQLEKKAGDTVAAGEKIGATDDQGTPVYFEIRSRNVAVNPMQWVASK